MKMCFVVCLLAVSSIGCADSLYVGPDTVVLVEQKVWSPVNWASFDQDKIVSYKDYQYTVYWAANRELSLARRHLHTNEVQIVRFNDYILADGRPERQQRNGHRNTVIGISPGDGRLHLSWDHHNNDLNYLRSRKGLITDPPETLTAAHFESRQPLTQEDPQRVTYPRFFNDPDERLYFFYRTGGSGRGDSVFFEYDDQQGTWQIITDRLFGHEGLYSAWENSTSRNAYMHDILFDTAGRLHISWVYRETFQTWASNHDLHYAYSEDQGRTWKNNQGNRIADTRQGQQIVLDSPGIVVFEIPVFSWLMNQCGMTLDSQNRPHVATFHLEKPYVPENLQHDPPAHVRQQLNYYHYWRDHSGKWHRSEPLPKSGSRPMIVAGTDDTIIIYFSTRQGLMAHVARPCDDWQTWTTLRLTGPEFWVTDVTKPDRRLLRDHGILSFTANPSPRNEDFGFAILEFDMHRIIDMHINPSGQWNRSRIFPMN